MKGHDISRFLVVTLAATGFLMEGWAAFSGTNAPKVLRITVDDKRRGHYLDEYPISRGKREGMQLSRGIVGKYLQGG